MADYDLFDLTGLSFDPPEKSGKKVKTAIENVEESIRSMLGSTSQQAQRDELKGKLSFLANCKKDVLTDDGKTTACFEKLARERRNTAKKRLEAVIELEKYGKKELLFTSGKIKSHTKITRLSKESIKEIYDSHGFKESDIDPLAAFPKFPTNIEKIVSELEILRGSKDPNPNGADLTIVHNLYDFVAYLRGEPKNALKYRGMPTKDIALILDEYATKNATRTDSLGKLCISIASAGKTFVFNKEANRNAYEQFLRYNSPELTKLFSIMKDYVDSNFHDPGFADVCIKKITEVFKDSDVALAIYNYKAGLKDNPYVPEKAAFLVPCTYCGCISDYTSLDEAQRENRCMNCKRELYKKCKHPHCRKMVLSSAKRCPECGFVFATVGLFTEYYSRAESALKQGELEKARKQLTRAKIFNPDEHIQTESLEKKLEAEETKIAEPLKQLRVLMISKQYEAAEDFLGEMVKKYPQINLSEQQKEINSILSVCRTKFADCSLLPLQGKISTCLDILDLCEDYRQALEFLRNNPPVKLERIEASYDDEKKSIILNWVKRDDIGVSYTVVRRVGSNAAVSIDNGVVILSESVNMSYVDASIDAGKQYSYSVFAVRKGSCSKATSTVVRSLAGVSEIRYWQKANALIISWRLPNNCQGANVTYSVGGKEFLLAENIHESAELKNINFGSPYQISVVADYGSLGKSAKKHISVTPTPVVESFRIQAGQVQDGSCKIEWSISNKGIDVQVLVNEKIAQTTRSEMRSCTLELPQNNHFRVQVKAFSGGQWVEAQNELLVNTYESVNINGELSTITEGVDNQVELKIKIDGNIPREVVAFYCVVKTKEPGATKAPWATESDVGGTVDRIDSQTYKQWNEITKRIKAHSEDAYYVTLFSVYRAGEKEILSAPCKKKFNRPLNADVFWKVTKPFIGNARLWIDIEANMPIEKKPGMVLCSSPSGKHLLSPNDGTAVELLKIDESYYDEPEKILKESYEIASGIKRHEKVFLFVTDISDNKRYAVRWAAGFLGKI